MEKPIALDSDRLERIVQEAGPDSSRILVGYNRRFYESVTPVRQALRNLPLVSIELNLPEVTSTLKNSYSSAILPHILVYMSSHWYDLLLFLIGEVTVTKMYARFKPGDSHACAYNGLMWSEQFRVPIHVQSNFDSPSNVTLAFHFEDRIYRLSPVETLTVFRGMRKERSADGQNRYRPEIEQVLQADATYKPGLRRQMENFIGTCVFQTRPNDGGCTLEEALQVTRLLDQIRSQSQRY